MVIRIIAGSDLRRTNHKGQTILYSAIKENMPISFIKTLLKHGLDITMRDSSGQTARDYALCLFRDEYVECLDQHVYDVLRARNVARLNRYVMSGYGDVISKLVSSNTAESRAIGHDLAEKRNMKPIADVLENLPILEVNIRIIIHFERTTIE